MPRKQIFADKEKPELNESEGKEKLNHLIKDYSFNKAKEKEFKDMASAENTEIKAIMNNFNITEFSTEYGTAKLSERVSEDFIEDKLIAFLKERGLAKNIIKTKEYVDFDALESAIYHEEISGDNLKDMAECKERKITQVLRIV